MIINGYKEESQFYSLIEDKLKELGITEEHYPIRSIKIAEMYKDKLVIEYRKFPSRNICGILHKGTNISSMCLNSLRSEKGRNFDCMHELIHYWFHPNRPKPCIANNFIKQSDIFEWQANGGAAHALMRRELFFRLFMAYKGDIQRLSDYFFVGKKAVEYRIRNLGLTDINFNQLRLFGRKPRTHCRICGNTDFSYSDNYCSICGSDIFEALCESIFWIDYDKGVGLDYFRRAAVCPVCNNHDLPKYEYTCNRCGTTIHQKCADNRDKSGRLVEGGCGSKPESNARYCRKCGHETSFYRSGALKVWYKEMAEKLTRKK